MSTVGTSAGRRLDKEGAFSRPSPVDGAGSSGAPLRNCRDHAVIELVCDACGYAVCAAGEASCDVAQEGRASFCTREEFERRRVEDR